jgi:hypothetical protein
MGQQAGTIRMCLASDDPWQAMGNNFAGLAEVGHVLASVCGENLVTVRKQLVALYSRHAREWEHVQADIKPGATVCPSMNLGSAMRPRSRHS